MSEHKTIDAALLAAQKEMGKALKQSTNPHFRSKYADLSSVMDACLPALHANGVFIIQPSITEDGEHYVETRLIHAASQGSLSCRVPLIVDKSNMQGYGSAVTYSRRYGLMQMAGICPEDDDGNAAAAAAAPPKAATISDAEKGRLESLIKQAGKTVPEICKGYGIKELGELPKKKLNGAIHRLKEIIADSEEIETQSK